MNPVQTLIKPQMHKKALQQRTALEPSVEKLTSNLNKKDRKLLWLQMSIVTGMTF